MLRIAVILSLFASKSIANAFSFTIVSPPAQCANLTISWSGGTPPYEITLLPVYHVYPEIRTIVDNNSTTGFWEQQLLYPQVSDFIIVLSDATGFGTGGTSEVLTVGGGNSSCLPTSPSQPSFDFYLTPQQPSQCDSLDFSWETTAKPPIVISAIIPGGDSFEIVSGLGLDGTSEVMDYSWDVNLKEGTVVAFMVGDETGRWTGGSSDLLLVGGGNTSSCLTGSYPSSTAAPAAGGVTPSSLSSMSGSSSASSTLSGLTTTTVTSTITTGIPATTTTASTSPSACNNNCNKNSASFLFPSSPLGIIAGTITTGAILLASL